MASSSWQRYLVRLLQIINETSSCVWWLVRLLHVFGETGKGFWWDLENQHDTCLLSVELETFSIRLVGVCNKRKQNIRQMSQQQQQWRIWTGRQTQTQEWNVIRSRLPVLTEDCPMESLFWYCRSESDKKF